MTMNTREVNMGKSSLALLLASLFVAALLPGCKGCPQESKQKTYTNPLATPEETVKAYCDLDASGKRLSSRTWAEVRPYISWTEEPGWDTAVVISGYQAASVTKRSETVSQITVEYQVTGDVARDFTPMKTVEAVMFTVRKTDEGWKITSPDFMPPHVLVKPLISHLEGVNRALAQKIREAVKE